MSGLPERWQRSDTNSPYSQATVHDGNQVTVIPIVNWPCRGGALSVELTLYHNALDTLEEATPPPPEKPPLGYGWTHSFRANLVADPTTGDVTITEGDGRRHTFTKNPDQSYSRPAGIFETLVKNGDGSFTLTRKDQIKWNFDANGKLTSIVDLNGNSISLNYAAGNLSSVVDPSGRTLSLSYDANGFLISVTDPLARVFTFSFSGTPKHLWKVNEPSPSTLFLEFGYDERKQVTSIRSKRGNVWSFAYDPAPSHVLTTVTNPQSNTRTYTYLINSTNVIDENGNRTEYFFGAGGALTRLDRYPDPMAPSVIQLFDDDANFNVTADTKPSGAVWAYTYDSNGNLLTVEDPITASDPNVTRATFTYNAANRLASATDAAGHQFSYSYNATQNLVQVTDAAANVSTHGYNAFGNRTSQTVNGKTTTFGYDVHGNLTSVTDPLNNVTTFAYNALSWRTSRTDALSRTTTYAYDTMGRVTTITYPDNSTVTFSYDGDGNRTGMTDSTGTTSWTYSALNLVTAETKGTNSISYTRDAGGRVTSLTDQAAITVNYTYDGVNAITKASRGPNWEATYVYDSNGNLTNSGDPNGTTMDRSYNAADWLTSLVNKQSNGTTISSFTYAHNIDGLVRSITELDASQVTYGYDSLHRLTSEVRTGANPYSISYAYDPAGNRTSRVKSGVTTTYTYDDANRLLTATGATYSWNANGNLTSKTVGGTTTSFAYDFDDRLTSITGPATVAFSYDGLGRRASRTAAGVTTAFFFDENRITAEKQGSTVTGHFTYGVTRVSRDVGANSVFYHVDGLGSARQLTDNTEAVVKSYLFEAFGELVSQSGTAENPYQFAGAWNYRADGDAGLIQVGARYYDPQVGRFITADLVLGTPLNPQSLNRYPYVENNPVNAIDPTGKFPWGVVLAIAFIIGLIILAVVIWKKVTAPGPPGRLHQKTKDALEPFQPQPGP